MVTLLIHSGINYVQLQYKMVIYASLTVFYPRSSADSQLTSMPTTSSLPVTSQSWTQFFLRYGLQESTEETSQLEVFAYEARRFLRDRLVGSKHQEMFDALLYACGTRWLCVHHIVLCSKYGCGIFYSGMLHWVLGKPLSSSRYREDLSQ